MAGNSVSVTSRPPDLLKTGVEEEAGLNLFLYHTSHNTTLRNHGLPAFDSRGDRVANPPLALDLHYLLMAYGKDEYQAEILMGYAMQLLHETPVLSRRSIQDSLSAIPSFQVSGSILPPAYQALAAADLADQIELVKICPEPLSVEDLSKLWSAFQANHFRLTSGYTASVVLIQSRKSTRASLPVLKSNLYVMPLKHPRILEVISAAPPPADVRITAASTIFDRRQRPARRRHAGADRRGHRDPGRSRRRADLHRPEHGGRPARGRAGHTSDPRPADGRSSAWSTTPRVRVECDALRLHPTITVPANYSARQRNHDGGFQPAAGKAQRVTLYLYEHGAPETRPARAYSFPAPRNNGVVGAATTTANIAFAVGDVVPGAYLAYVSVDGAESPLGLVAGTFDSPRVMVTA